MAWYNDWDDFKESAGNVYDRIRNNAPMRGEGEYAGVDRGNYNLPGYEQYAQSTQQFADTRGGGPFRAGQERLAGRLERMGTGQDSYSKEQLRQSMGRLQSQQMSMAAGAPSSQNALAQRLAMRNASRIGGGLAGEQALAGIQERNAANMALGGMLGQARGQDTQAYLGGTELGLRAAGMQQQGGMNYEQNRTQRAGYAMNAPSTKEALIGALQGAGQSMLGIPSFGGGGGGGGGGMPASYWNTFGGSGASGPGGGSYY